MKHARQTPSPRRTLIGSIRLTMPAQSQWKSDSSRCQWAVSPTVRFSATPRSYSVRSGQQSSRTSVTRIGDRESTRPSAS